MGIIGSIMMVVFILLLLWGGRRLYLLSKKHENEKRKVLRLASQAIFFAAFIVVVWAFHTFIVEIPTPFKGPSVGNNMPNHQVDNLELTEPPKVSATHSSPNMETVIDQHQKQLHEFEREGH